MTEHKMTFDDLLFSSRRFNRDDFVRDFGGLVDDVATMLGSEVALSALRYARDHIESNKDEILPNGMKRLMRFDFGTTENAPELLRGEVAAVDGTPVLPLQRYSAGQALCVGIGSRSYTRKMDEVLHGYTGKVMQANLSTQPDDIREFLDRVEQGTFAISQTAYMRYYEAIHAIEIHEPFVLCDGTLLYEWLINQDIGREKYKEFMKKKKAFGVMKDLKESIYLSWLGRALEPGEVYVWETVHQHAARMKNVPRQNRAERQGEAPQWESDREFVDLAKKVFRGVFKPAQKAFGFECHIDHFEPMLRIAAADCQMNQPGHEIPFLLNEIDKEIRRFFKSDVVKMRIGHRLSRDSETLFFGETNERDFRS